MSEIKSAKDAIEFAQSKGAVMVDLRFIDLPGMWQHTSVPIHRLDEDAFEDGFGFDGSSIRGFQPINASDMLIIPDPTTAKMDPYTKHPTVVFVCDIVDPITREPYGRDPRYVSRKAAAYLKQTGIADTCFCGPEAEFSVFDNVRYGSSPNASFYEVDSAEAAWNTSSDNGPNLGYKIQHKGGYFPVMPTDTLMDLRTDMSQARPRPSCRSRSTTTTAAACMCISHYGRTASPSSPATATLGSARLACTTSAASSSTRAPSPRSPTQP